METLLEVANWFEPKDEKALVRDNRTLDTNRLWTYHCRTYLVMLYPPDSPTTFDQMNEVLQSWRRQAHVYKCSSYYDDQSCACLFDHAWTQVAENLPPRSRSWIQVNPRLRSGGINAKQRQTLRIWANACWTHMRAVLTTRRRRDVPPPPPPPYETFTSWLNGTALMHMRHPIALERWNRIHGQFLSRLQACSPPHLSREAMDDLGQRIFTDVAVKYFVTCT